MTNDDDKLLPRQLAEVLETSVQQINAWHKKGMPRDDDGRYDVNAAKAWLKENEPERQPVRRIETPPETLAEPVAAMPETDDTFRPVCPVHYCKMVVQRSNGSGELPVRKFVCRVKGCDRQSVQERDHVNESVPSEPHICCCGLAAIVDPKKCTPNQIALKCPTDQCNYFVKINAPRRTQKRQRRDLAIEQV